MRETVVDAPKAILEADVLTMFGICPGCNRDVEPGSYESRAMWSTDIGAVVCRICGVQERAAHEAAVA